MKTNNLNNIIKDALKDKNTLKDILKLYNAIAELDIKKDSKVVKSNMKIINDFCNNSMHALFDSINEFSKFNTIKPVDTTTIIKNVFNIVNNIKNMFNMVDGLVVDINMYMAKNSASIDSLNLLSDKLINIFNNINKISGIYITDSSKFINSYNKNILPLIDTLFSFSEKISHSFKNHPNIIDSNDIDKFNNMVNGLTNLINGVNNTSIKITSIEIIDIEKISTQYELLVDSIQEIYNIYDGINEELKRINEVGDILSDNKNYLDSFSKITNTIIEISKIIDNISNMTISIKKVLKIWLFHNYLILTLEMTSFIIKDIFRFVNNICKEIESNGESIKSIDNSLKDIVCVFNNVNLILSLINDLIDSKKNPLMGNVLAIFIIKKKINKTFDNLIDVISIIKEKIIQLIDHIQDVTESIKGNNVNETINNLTSLINSLFSCINDLIDSKKNLLMGNVLVIFIIKKKINKTFDNLLDVISNIKEKIIQLIDHIQDVTESIKDNNVNETVNSLTSLINNLFSCITDIIDPKKNPLMGNALTIFFVKKKINKVFKNLLSVISSIKDKIIQLTNHIQDITASIDAEQIKKSTTILNGIFKNIYIIINNIFKLSSKSALLILLAPMAFICIGICSLLILAIVFMLSKLDSLNFKKLYLTTIKVKILFDRISDILTKLGLIAISIILLAPVMAIAILLSPLVLLEIYIFTFIIRALVHIINLIKVRHINKIQFMLLKIGIILIMFISLSLLLILLQTVAIHIKFGVIIAVLLGIMALAAVLMFVGFLCSNFVVFLTPVILAIGLTLLAMIIIVGSLLLLAVLLNELNEIELNVKNVKKKVRDIMGVVAEIISAIFDSTDDTNPEPSKKGFFKTLFDNLFMGSAQMIGAIMAVGYLALMTISVLLILFIAAILRVLQIIELEPDKIKENVRIVMNTARDVINLLFDSSDDKNNEPSKKGFFKTLFDNLFMGSAQMIGAIMAMGYLALMTVSVLLILFIATTLRVLQVIELDPGKIKENVSLVMSTANSIIEAIFKPDTTETKPAKPSLTSLLKWACPGTVALIEAMMTLGYLVIIMIAIGTITIIAKNLNYISKLPSLKGVDKKTKDIVNAAKSVVTAVFDPKTGNIEKISDSAEKSIKYLKKISSIISQLGSISKDFNKLASIDKKQIDKSNTSIQSMLSCLTTPFEKQKEFSVTKVNAVLKVIQHMNEMLSMSSNGFNNSKELLKNYTEFVTKVDNADLAKLKTTVKMFEQMNKFSESINGNFDKLAESLNEKIAPLLEDLKESMGRVATNSERPSDMQAEKNSIKTQMQANGQTKNMTKKEIDNKVNNKYNKQQQQNLGIDEITSKLTILINLFRDGNAIVRTS